MYYDSLNPFYKKPFGACVVNKKIDFFVELFDADEVYLVIKKDGKPYEYVWMDKTKKLDKDGFSVSFTPDETGLYFYHFQINVDRGRKFIYKGENNDYQLTVYNEYKVPDWYKKGIIYQIFPDRFYNPYPHPIATKPNSFIYGSWYDKPMNIINIKGEMIRDDFYGGNLYGIIEKLDYLHDLGVTILYLNPIFESHSNHKYNTKDYHKIDSMFGDEETYKKLIEECEKRGMSVILDGVFNHTGDDSEYFQQAVKDKESKYFPWYYFKNYPDEYETWWGFQTLPKVNCKNKSYIDFIMGGEGSVLHHWTSLGAKGWRLDVVDELEDSFVEMFKEKMREIDPESVLIGEVWEDASNKMTYSKRRNYFMGKELDSVMGYPFKDNLQAFLNGEITGLNLLENFNTLKENYPREAYYSNMNIISTHDTPRCINTLKMDETNFLSAVTVQMTFAGVPHIYYADEVGETGDMCPDNRRGYPWGRENAKVLGFYKNLIRLRKNNRVFTDGEIEFFHLNDDAFFYRRHLEGENDVFVLILRNGANLTIDFGHDYMYEYFSSRPVETNNGVINKYFDKGHYIFSMKKFEY